MKLQKAIEILADSAYSGVTTFNQDFKDATKLGIEALKRHKLRRQVGYRDDKLLLPGETE